MSSFAPLLPSSASRYRGNQLDLCLLLCAATVVQQLASFPSLCKCLRVQVLNRPQPLVARLEDSLSASWNSFFSFSPPLRPVVLPSSSFSSLPFPSLSSFLLLWSYRSSLLLARKKHFYDIALINKSSFTIHSTFKVKIKIEQNYILGICHNRIVAICKCKCSQIPVTAQWECQLCVRCKRQSGIKCGLAAHICHFFQLTVGNPVCRDKKCRILMFRNKKCHILKFRDKTVLNNVNGY